MIVCLCVVRGSACDDHSALCKSYGKGQMQLCKSLMTVFAHVSYLSFSTLAESASQ